MGLDQVTEDYTKKLEEELRLKDTELEELKKKLSEIENKLNELNRELEQRVIARTVEVNRLLLHKTKYIDNLSHDLGTPLTPLLALLPLIKEDIKDPKTRDLIDTCIRSAEYIKRVVNNTRELAELNTTDLYLKRENLLEIVTGLQQKYEGIFRTCNIKVENYVEREVYVNTEMPRLAEVLDHIYSNAVNSMVDGGTLTFVAEPVEQKTGPFVRISVHDTGVGLSKEQIDHIFDEFYKTDDSRHKLDSTGLGLSICKRIVEKHGGKIWAESPGPGRGATICFTIPSS
ncbi:MAG: HAMP domain-containing sensor histidine kinase [Euryarchaeota archaeon]|nr:HAMP domain-containing sensor histidine kinase [Euryarchaeota archaeon]